MVFVPSAKQAEFFDFVSSGQGSCNLISVAGSGKSTSILRSFPYIPASKKVLYLVFNTRNSEDMKSKVKNLEIETGRSYANVRVATFHSHGFGLLRWHLQSRNIQIGKPDSNKCRKLFKEMVKEEDFILYSSFVTKLVAYAKGEGLGILRESNTEAYLSIIDHHDMSLEHEKATIEKGITFARALMATSYKAAKDGNIDYDDMLFMPLALNLRWFKQDYIFGDEMQDSNPVRREIMKRSCHANTRVFAVGDPCQAIYGFTGATKDAMDLIKHEFNAIDMYLNVSFRCPKAVVESVKNIVPYFEVNDTNKEGDVFDVTLSEALEILTEKDAILCRNVAPLVSLAFKLIGQGRACHVLGSEIGQGLIKLVNQMQATDIDDLQVKLTSWRDREMSAAMAKDQEQKAAGIADRAECLFVMMESLPEITRTVQGLIGRITALFQDDEPTLTLSSMHKAKGMEWENVVIYRYDLMPSPWARQPWQAQQEQHLDYVARTRAMNYLMFMGDVK